MVGSEPRMGQWGGIKAGPLPGKKKKTGGGLQQSSNKCPVSFLSTFCDTGTKTFSKAHCPAEDYISQLPLQPKGPRDYALPNEMREAAQLPVPASPFQSPFWGNTRRLREWHGTGEAFNKYLLKSKHTSHIPQPTPRHRQHPGENPQMPPPTPRRTPPPLCAPESRRGPFCTIS